MSDLPSPRTVTDELLTAVHGELVGLRADLAASRQPVPADGGRVELREPTKRTVDAIDRDLTKRTIDRKARR